MYFIHFSPNISQFPSFLYPHSTICPLCYTNSGSFCKTERSTRKLLLSMPCSYYPTSGYPEASLNPLQKRAGIQQNNGGFIAQTICTEEIFKHDARNVVGFHSPKWNSTTVLLFVAELFQTKECRTASNAEECLHHSR